MTSPEHGPADGGEHRPRRGHALAWILIFLGVLLTISNLYGISEGVFFIVLGAAFLAGYLSNRSYGLLIPAMILIGLGFGLQVADWYLLRIDDLWVPLFIGFGFMAIWFVDHLTWKQSTTWPLWPGGILVVIGIWGIALETGFFRDIWWEFTEILGQWWPVLLILWGVWLLVRGRSPAGEPEQVPPASAAPAPGQSEAPDAGTEPAEAEEDRPPEDELRSGPLGGGESD